MAFLVLTLGKYEYLLSKVAYMDVLCSATYCVQCCSFTKEFYYE